jgi:hypothetical protein
MLQLYQERYDNELSSLKEEAILCGAKLISLMDTMPSLFSYNNWHCFFHEVSDDSNAAQLYWCRVYGMRILK